MEELKNPPKQVVDAVKTVLIAKAYTRTVRGIIEPIQQEVLNKFKYFTDPAHERRGVHRVTKDRDTYLMSEKDFGHYLTEVYQRRVKTFPDIPFDYCPLLVAENLERQAIGALIDELEPFTGLDSDRLICSGMDTYNEYVELNLNYLTQFIRP